MPSMFTKMLGLQSAGAPRPREGQSAASGVRLLDVLLYTMLAGGVMATALSARMMASGVRPVRMLIPSLSFHLLGPRLGEMHRDLPSRVPSLTRASDPLGAPAREPGLVESGRPDKLLTLRGERLSPERLRIAVTDNGVGIAPEEAPRLFTQGFTTKKTGHGFGLHLSALAAREMDAFLSCSSEGRGHGATFTLDLPMSGEESRA